MTDPSVVRAECVGLPVGRLPPAGMVFVDPSVVRTGRIGPLVGPLPPAGMMFVDPGTPWLLWKSCRAPVWSLQTSKKSGFPAQQTSRRRPRLHAEFIPEDEKLVDFSAVSGRRRPHGVEEGRGRIQKSGLLPMM